MTREPVRDVATLRFMPWSEDELVTLRSLSAQGMPIASVALRLGRSYDSVRRRLRREGIVVARIGPVDQSCLPAVEGINRNIPRSAAHDPDALNPLGSGGAEEGPRWR